MYILTGYNRNRDRYIYKKYIDFDTAYKIQRFCNTHGWKIGMYQIQLQEVNNANKIN